MKPITKIAAAGILAITSVIPVSFANAAPIAVQKPAVEAGSDVTSIEWRRTCNRNGCRRVWHDRRAHRPRVVVRPRVVIRERVSRPRVIVRSPAVRAGNRHVQWCLNRYRSYNPATDQYLAYAGEYRYCNSPYR
jgi:hypothetical protein